MEFEIKFTANPKPEDIKILTDGITKNAMQMKGMKPIKHFAFFVHDKDKIVAGCSGCNFYDGLHIRLLWVSEPLRRKGYGSKLMESAENFAKSSDCHFIAVNTMSFEALEFYKKIGFYIEFERRGYDKNSVFYCLRKDFK